MAWTSPRTWVASEVVSAAIMNTHVRDNLLAAQDRIQVVYKAADETVNNNATIQNDDHLKFTAVAGQNYSFDFNLIVACTSTAADFQVGFSFPAGTLNFSIVGLDTAATSTTASVRTPAAVGVTSGTTTLAVGTSGTTVGVLVRGSFKCTTGGTVNLMWAQNTATVVDLTVKQGSTVTAIRETI